MTKEEIQKLMADEFADVFAYLLVFADQEGIDPATAVKNKWFKYLD